MQRDLVDGGGIRLEDSFALPSLLDLLLPCYQGVSLLGLEGHSVCEYEYRKGWELGRAQEDVHP